MKGLKGLFRMASVWAIATVGLGAIVSPVQAANEIVFRYGILRQRLSVEELVRFAQTGDQSPVLERYLKRVNSNPDEIRQALNQTVDVSQSTLDKGLNNTLGNLLLDELGRMIQTPDDQGNQEALKTALIRSAANDNQLTILEVLQNYPADEIHLDVMRAVKTYNRLAKYQQPVQNILQKVGPIRQILKEQGINLPNFLK